MSGVLSKVQAEVQAEVQEFRIGSMWKVRGD